MQIEPTDLPTEGRIKALWIRAVESGCFNDPIARVVDRFIVLVASEVEASRQRPAAPKFGCHCDLENTVSGQPDECVFDNGDIEDCVYATELQRQKKGKADCKYWQPIKFAAPERPAAQAASAEPPLRYDVLYEIAATFSLDYNAVCKVANDYIATPTGERPAAPAQAEVTDRLGQLIDAAIEERKECLAAGVPSMFTSKDWELVAELWPRLDEIRALLAQASPTQPSGVSASGAWRCACGSALYIDAEGKPRSKAADGVPVLDGQTLPQEDADAAAKKDAFDEMEGK
jgi:hypothetical protein